MLLLVNIITNNMALPVTQQLDFKMGNMEYRASVCLSVGNKAFVPNIPLVGKHTYDHNKLIL